MSSITVHPPESQVSELFRAAFRRHAAGVAVITTAGPAGLTVSSVASVSAAPPALSFSVMGSRSGRALLEAPSLVINLLGPGHATLARDFASSGGARFTPGQGWADLPTGEPYLPDAVAALRAVPLHRIPVGESTLVIAEVVEVVLGEPAHPLIHHNKNFFIGTGEPAPNHIDPAP
ncbi:flavin reductase (DIM6/NTAB) family NADH-FMN oxidoreductase RutF [Actinoplanes campanulatus]|uniref:Flavin reductase (DIM6/NTAB) family NADH-FMN oxidoreductase RutF n=1 Tax=Actinoplanes campanulatus TaxID=113559 RepID=A0A7W5FK46_9ACTN|nr:flavin reductase family protein [Actinoplanes campanulatus]MBB3101292.1 flavin reductase (DIM6/NTAB) family NADH-FMN oxidoreductase RutF [Actinoplanes campanulatus]